MGPCTHTHLSSQLLFNSPNWFRARMWCEQWFRVHLLQNGELCPAHFLSPRQSTACTLYPHFTATLAGDDLINRSAPHPRVTAGRLRGAALLMAHDLAGISKEGSATRRGEWTSNILFEESGPEILSSNKAGIDRVRRRLRTVNQRFPTHRDLRRWFTYYVVERHILCFVYTKRPRVNAADAVEFGGETVARCLQRNLPTDTTR